MSFFPFRGPPGTPKPRKTHGFLIVPKKNPETPKGPKHRKTRCFWTPCAKNTVNYVGFGGEEVTPSWSAAGAARHYNLRLPTEGLRQGHGSPWQWPAPGLKGLRHLFSAIFCQKFGNGILCGRRSIWWCWRGRPVAPRTVNDVSYVMRTKYVSLSAWQAQYLVRLDRDTCCSAHCKWCFICDED